MRKHEMNSAPTEYMVLVNEEEQHSLWPSFKMIPPGWRQVGPVGTKEACLIYVEEVWPDITPLSERTSLAEAKAEREASGSQTH